ncbi:MAG: hypothetical protein CBC42_04765 [Betaproteobacteria bacterium TMED82]|nr:MAG: hypothetical protein CBC42_04765 [Betaproteobacteria bacterium TMED82]|tara:strand:- start:13997 stop:15184 length:1188 start_codon:yes stop_codon:yes gene_type:complete
MSVKDEDSNIEKENTESLEVEVEKKNSTSKPRQTKTKKVVPVEEAKASKYESKEAVFTDKKSNTKSAYDSEEKKITSPVARSTFMSKKNILILLFGVLVLSGSAISLAWLFSAEKGRSFNDLVVDFFSNKNENVEAVVEEMEKKLFIPKQETSNENTASTEEKQLVDTNTNSENQERENVSEKSSADDVIDQDSAEVKSAALEDVRAPVYEPKEYGIASEEESELTRATGNDGFNSTDSDKIFETKRNVTLQLLAEIEGLIQRVVLLKFNNRPKFDTVYEDTSSGNQNLSDWTNIIEILKSFFVIQKITDPYAGLRSQDFFVLVREQLKIYLISSRSILIADNFYAHSLVDLTEAKLLVEKYFDNEDELTKDFKMELGSIMKRIELIENSRRGTR